MRAERAWVLAGLTAIAAGCGADIGSPSDDMQSGAGGPDGGGDRPDAAPRSDGGTDDCVEGWNELLINPHFDQGPDVGWTSAGGDIIRLDADMPIHVDSGQYAAWLGGRNELDATLSQPISIPDQASDLRLSAKTCFVTAETAGTHDSVEVVLRDGGGAVVGSISDYTNQDAEDICNWGSVQISSSPAHAGQDLTFEIHVTTDAANHTSFYFDTLALEALSECGS
ncbi:MAG TPA: hypothetical protein VIG06_03275 [Kofleriaceae bacterium]